MEATFSELQENVSGLCTLPYLSSVVVFSLQNVCSQHLVIAFAIVHMLKHPRDINYPYGLQVNVHHPLLYIFIIMFIERNVLLYTIWWRWSKHEKRRNALNSSIDTFRRQTVIGKEFHLKLFALNKRLFTHLYTGQGENDTQHLSCNYDKMNLKVFMVSTNRCTIQGNHFTRLSKFRSIPFRFISWRLKVRLRFTKSVNQ